MKLFKILFGGPKGQKVKNEGPFYMPEYTKPNYKDKVYLRLTKQCAMGDIVSMAELAEWFFKHLSPKTGAAFEDYMRDPTIEHLCRLEDRICDDFYEEFISRAYITWIVRAALYGNEAAEAIVSKCGAFGRMGIIKEKTYRAGSYTYENYGMSFELHELGFTDIPSGLDEFGILSINKDGIYAASYLADYIAADSDGFGREEEYCSVFYDEFFNRLADGSKEKAAEGLFKMRQKREKYWSDPANDREHRMYKRLLSQSEN